MELNDAPRYSVKKGLLSPVTCMPSGALISTSPRWAALGAVLLLFVSCATASPLGTLPPPDADLGLGDVVMMTWTTRSHEGILGHVLADEGPIAVDSHRQVAVGKPRLVSTDQTLELVVARETLG